jgi:anti-anti-sigma factor
MRKNLFVETRPGGVYAVRFNHPDLPALLDASGDTEDCALLRELGECVLNGLAAGEGLVLNLGRVEIITSAMLGFLLRVREIVRQRRGWLVLCHLRDDHREVLEITKTIRLFRIASSEQEAVAREETSS